MRKAAEREHRKPGYDGRSLQAWLEKSGEGLVATVRDLPLREHIDVPVREQLIVELYSK